MEYINHTPAKTHSLTGQHKTDSMFAWLVYLVCVRAVCVCCYGIFVFLFYWVFISLCFRDFAQHFYLFIFIIWGFQIMNPDHTHFHVLPGPLPTLVTSLDWSMFKLQVPSPLKKIESLPTLTPSEAINCRELHFRILITIFIKIILLFYWEFHITHPILLLSQSLHILSSLHSIPQKKIFKILIKNKTKYLLYSSIFPVSPIPLHLS